MWDFSFVFFGLHGKHGPKNRTLSQVELQRRWNQTLKAPV